MSVRVGSMIWLACFAIMLAMLVGTFVQVATVLDAQASAGHAFHHAHRHHLRRCAR